ncbi:hypothetical protein SAMN05216207_103322 [Pseudonocardia ammonioxydans]|uniref:Uncharacterized protein n=1 Tax=Pseudonocardia ammonioxydans TaxID=260086 RepID=A0A1I5EVC9_PSUAM|nr:hypothetical protein SAMN05216207_103322 [Pseudonocardia ammonioxydans]
MRGWGAHLASERLAGRTGSGWLPALCPAVVFHVEQGSGLVVASRGPSVPAVPRHRGRRRAPGPARCLMDQSCRPPCPWPSEGSTGAAPGARTPTRSGLRTRRDDRCGHRRRRARQGATAATRTSSCGRPASTGRRPPAGGDAEPGGVRSRRYAHRPALGPTLRATVELAVLADGVRDRRDHDGAYEVGRDDQSAGIAPQDERTGVLCATGPTGSSRPSGPSVWPRAGTRALRRCPRPRAVRDTAPARCITGTAIAVRGAGPRARGRGITTLRARPLRATRRFCSA